MLTTCLIQFKTHSSVLALLTWTKRFGQGSLEKELVGGMNLGPSLGIFEGRCATFNMFTKSKLLLNQFTDFKLFREWSCNSQVCIYVNHRQLWQTCVLISTWEQEFWHGVKSSLNCYPCILSLFKSELNKVAVFHLLYLFVIIINMRSNNTNNIY